MIPFFVKNEGVARRPGRFRPGVERHVSDLRENANLICVAPLYFRPGHAAIGQERRLARAIDQNFTAQILQHAPGVRICRPTTRPFSRSGVTASHDMYSAPRSRAASSSILSKLLRVTDQVQFGIIALVSGQRFFTSTQNGIALWIVDVDAVFDRIILCHQLIIQRQIAYRISAFSAQRFANMKARKGFTFDDERLDPGLNEIKRCGSSPWTSPDYDDFSSLHCLSRLSVSPRGWITFP